MKKLPEDAEGSAEEDTKVRQIKHDMPDSGYGKRNIVHHISPFKMIIEIGKGTA